MADDTPVDPTPAELLAADAAFAAAIAATVEAQNAENARQGEFDAASANLDSAKADNTAKRSAAKDAGDALDAAIAAAGLD